MGNQGSLTSYTGVRTPLCITDQSPVWFPSTTKSTNNKLDHGAITCLNESCFLFHHMDGQVCPYFIWWKPGIRMHYGEKASWWWQYDALDNVLLENLVTLTCTTYISIVADHVHPSMETAFPNGWSLPQSKTMSVWCWVRLQILLI